MEGHDRPTTWAITILQLRYGSRKIVEVAPHTTLLRLWFLWFLCCLLLLRGCCLRHGMRSFRLRAYLVLFLAGSRDLASSERRLGVYFRRHKQMFGGL